MKRISYLATIGMALMMVWGLLTILSVETATAESTFTTATQEAPFPDQRDAVQQAILWLVNTHQNDDGGYTSFSVGVNQAASDVGGTLDAILAISSGGYNPAAPAPGKENTPIDYLRQNIDDVIGYASVDGGTAGKLVLALAAAGQNPRDFEGNDFVLTLNEHLSSTGQFNVNNAFNQSLAVLALSGVNEPAPETAVTWLLSQQAVEGDFAGSWDDGFGTAGNADATAMSVMALISTNLTDTVSSSLSLATDFLTRTQLESGGWEYGAGFGENVNSTSMVIQALAALGQDFYTPDANGISPLAALFFRQGESGAFQADFGDGPFDDFFSTVQAVPAAAGKPFPLPGRFEAARQAVDCLTTLQDPETGGWEQFATFGVDAGGTSRAIQAIVAVGDDPTTERWTVNGVNAVQALENLTPDYLSYSAGGGLGIVIQGVVAAGGDVGDFAGTDLVLAITTHLSPTGEYDSTAFGPFAHAEAMMGLLAAGADVDETAVTFLLNSHTNGDWGGVDTNGIALNVLGQLGLSVPEAIDVLHATQEADGGWGFGVANPNSSSEVVQGLMAVGENPFAPAWSQVVSGAVTNAADAILAQQGENGCWPNLYGPGDDPFATTDAVLLLVQQPGWGLVGELPEPVLISAEPGQEPTPEPDVAVLPEAEESPAAEPTAVPAEPSAPTAVPEPTEAPELAEEPAQPELISEPAPEETASNTLTIVLVVLAVLIVAGGAYKRRMKDEG